MKDLSHINTWIFDLDNTLYPATCKLFDQIAVRMTDYMVARMNISAAEAPNCAMAISKNMAQHCAG